MSGKKGMAHYPVDVKVEAVRMYLEEGRTQAEIAEALGLRSAGRVKIWVRQYRQAGPTAFQRDKNKVKLGRPPKRENTAAYIARLEMENDLLKKFHAELRKQELAKRNIGSSTTKEKHTK